MEIELTHFMRIVEGQARLEQKLDGFIAGQVAQDKKLEALEGRVGATEDDVAGLKAQRKTDIAVVSAISSVVVTAGGAIMWILQSVGWAAIKAAFSKL